MNVILFFSALKLKVPAVVVLNKIDLAPEEKIKSGVEFFPQRVIARM